MTETLTRPRRPAPEKKDTFVRYAYENLDKKAKGVFNKLFAESFDYDFPGSVNRVFTRSEPKIYQVNFLLNFLKERNIYADLKAEFDRIQNEKAA